jgi:hypothetical protein
MFAACSDDKGEDDYIGAPVVPDPDANEIVGQVGVEGAVGTYVDEAFPGGDGDGPLVLGASQYIQGASIVLEVTADDTATQLLVGVARTESGYYTIDLPGARSAAGGVEVERKQADHPKLHLSKVTGQRRPGVDPMASQSYILTISPAENPERTSFTVLVASSNGSAVTNTTSHRVRPNQTAAGSAQLQVSLNWAHPVDMDLHVETPEGVDIYWASQARQGPNGGELDLDSNAACQLDLINNENITWRDDEPTPGNYVVRVNLWSACAEAGPFPFVVTLMLEGEPTLYQGTLTLNDEIPGGAFAGNLITEFTVSPPAKRVDGR